MEQHACKNCGYLFEGKFCNNCGEKYFDAQHKSVKHLADEAFHFITHLDSKFLRTLKLVLFKTGKYSREYTEGKRKDYFKPVSLFLIIVVLYLLFPLFSGLNMKFDTYMLPKYNYSVFASPIVEKKLEHMTYAEVQQQYDDKSGKFSKVFLLLYLPLTALVLKLAFVRHKRYFYDHFVLATELNCFIVFVTYLVLPLVMVIAKLLGVNVEEYFSDNSMLFLFVQFFFMVITTLAFRRFYREGWISSSVKAGGFMVLYLFAIKYVYSIILFMIVMLFVK